MTNIRIVPIQQLCVMCGHELQSPNMARGLAARLCSVCIRLLAEQVVVRELEQQQKLKIVRV